MGKNILLLDDEELIVKSLTKLLEKNGFRVFVAKTGEDAITIAEEEDLDLIIADIRIPGINGVETVQKIYESFEKKVAKKIPVIFITGYADKKLEEEVKALCPIAYIYKPFDISILVDNIKKAIK